MAKTNIQLKSQAQASGKSITTSVTDINSTADSNTLKQLAQKLNALTTNTYVETNRINTINVDTEQVPIMPTAVVFAFNGQSKTYTRSGNAVTIPWTDFTYTGAGNITTMFGISNKQGEIGGVRPCYEGTNGLYLDATSGTGTYNLKLAILGTNDFDSATLTTTVQVS